LPHILFISFFFLVSTASGKEMSFSFDDAPMGNGNLYTGLERTKTLIQKLKENGIQAAFYVNSVNIPNDNGDQRLKLYAQAGHFLGNHTHSHPHLDKVGVDAYIEEIKIAHAHLKDYENFTPWFRFTYLNQGKTAAERDKIRFFLKTFGYFHAYTTLDNLDWLMNDLLNKAIKNKKQVNKPKVCNTYSEILWESLEFYDKAANQYMGRSPKHVLLLHENDLAALCIDQFINYVKAKGWRIISPKESYEDPMASKQPNTLYLNQGSVAATVNEMSGLKIRSVWENQAKLIDEFKKRKIFE